MQIYRLVSNNKCVNKHESIIERTVKWGILHFTSKHKFKNYTNITFIDEKLNLCDFFVDLMNKHCPIQPGMYHLNYQAQVPKDPSLFWPVSNRHSVSLLLFYFIGYLLCQRYCIQ